MTTSPLLADLWADLVTEVFDLDDDDQSAEPEQVEPEHLTREDFTKAEVSALFAAWHAWQAQPGSDWTAGRLEDQCKRAAAMLGTTASKVREWIIANVDRRGTP
jgi:hypothetical protein